jgi:hypothetical protein
MKVIYLFAEVVVATLGLFVPVNALGLEARFPPELFCVARRVSPLLLSADGALEEDSPTTGASEDSCGTGIGLLGTVVFIGGGAFSTSGLIWVRGTITKSWLKKSVAPMRFAMGSFSRVG